MALAQAVSSWVDSGTTQSIDASGTPQTVPIYNPVYAGPWIYTNAIGGQSVVGDASLTQPQAEAARDAWLAAGGTV